MTEGDNPTLNEYEVLKKSFNNHIISKQNIGYETFKFRQLKQKEEESIDSYLIRLRTAATNCGFYDKENEILGQKSKGVRHKVFDEKF